jgi:hypothetical protein
MATIQASFANAAEFFNSLDTQRQKNMIAGAKPMFRRRAGGRDGPASCQQHDTDLDAMNKAENNEDAGLREPSSGK